MRTALLSAVAALVLTSTYSVSSFAQHDDDTYRAPDGGDGYRMHYRGDRDERSEDRQDNGHMDHGRDRWRDMGPMMRRGGARFQFSRGDARIDIRCPQNETLQSCVQAASQLIDKVHSLTLGPSEGVQGPKPSPDNH